MNRPTTGQLRTAIEERGYPLFQGGAYDLTLIGLRAIPGTTDAWDDMIGAVYLDDAGVWQSELFAATTDPGRPWLAQPSRPDGCAILVPGHYAQCWGQGMHKGQYPALVQRKAMTFARDGNRDGVVDFDSPTRTHEIIGCNLHRASSRQLVANVGLYSAGCQVIRSVDDFERLMQLALLQREHGHGAIYSYSLLAWLV